MTSLQDTLDSDDYDEFGLLHENAAEWDIPFEHPPVVARLRSRSRRGRRCRTCAGARAIPSSSSCTAARRTPTPGTPSCWPSAVRRSPIDLPGHGHSDRRDDRDYGPWQNAEAVAALMESVAPAARCVIGMSLGGATTIRLAAQRPDLCRRAVFVDVTPQINDPSRQLTTAERGTVSLIAGPRSTTASTRWPTPRSRSARTGRPRACGAGCATTPAGSRTAAGPGATTSSARRRVRRRRAARRWVDFTSLWEDVSAITVPTLFVRGGLSPFVRDEDIAEMQRRLPSLEVVVVDGAGHAVQSDQPLVLADLIRTFCI